MKYENTTLLFGSANKQRQITFKVKMLQTPILGGARAPCAINQMCSAVCLKHTDLRTGVTTTLPPTRHEKRHYRLCHGWLSVLLQLDGHWNDDDIISHVFIIRIFVSNKQAQLAASWAFIIMCAHHPSNWINLLATSLTQPHMTGSVCT